MYLSTESELQNVTYSKSVIMIKLLTIPAKNLIKIFRDNETYECSIHTKSLYKNVLPKISKWILTVQIMPVSYIYLNLYFWNASKTLKIHGKSLKFLFMYICVYVCHQNIAVWGVGVWSLHSSVKCVCLWFAHSCMRCVRVCEHAHMCGLHIAVWGVCVCMVIT